MALRSFTANNTTKINGVNTNVYNKYTGNSTCCSARVNISRCVLFAVLKSLQKNYILGLNLFKYVPKTLLGSLNLNAVVRDHIPRSGQTGFYMS